MRLRITLGIAVAMLGLAAAKMAVATSKPSSVKGSIYRGDKSHPVSGAVIVFLDQKHSGEGFGTKTDENGSYEIPNVIEGRYTVSIRTWHDRQEDVPCKLLLAKTKDKGSSVLVLYDQGKYVEQIFVEGFSVSSGKPIERDFDITCIGMWG